MGPFNETVLTGGASAGNINSVPSFFKEITDKSITTQLASLIKTNTFVRSIGGIVGKEMTEEVNGWGLVTANRAKKATAASVGD
jgi:hypothetical protein